MFVLNSILRKSRQQCALLNVEIALQVYPGILGFPSSILLEVFSGIPQAVPLTISLDVHPTILLGMPREWS